MLSASLPRIAVRIGGAFAIVLGFFIAALVLTSHTLDQIGAAEEQTAHLDRAKHAGHHVAAMAREMYIHQAHTIVTFGFEHLEHYEEWVAQTQHGIESLLSIAPTPQDRAQAERIGQLAKQIDIEFKRLIIPAIQQGQRGNILELHDRINTIRQQVIGANRALAADFERRSDAAREEAISLRARARLGLLGCTGFAAVAAALLGLLLMRSVLEPISALRGGALRLAEGDLSHRITWTGDDEFGELALTFNSMARKIAKQQEEALKAQRLQLLGEVTAGVAHEINNPLGVILGYLKLIERDGSASQERLQTITSEAKQCQRIVSDLLAVVRPSDLEPQEVDLSELALEAASRREETSKHPNLVAQVQQGAWVWGDPGKLRQVIDNVLANAVDACPTGAIHIFVHAGAEAQIQITDEGPGVPTDRAARIFDPFFTTKADGTGLGLAICKAIVETHGGTLVLGASEKGASFEIKIPSVQPKGDQR